jgi:hypothetical protein
MLSTVIPVDPGPQSISAEAPGYKSFQRTVDVDEGELEEVPIVLERVEEGSRDVVVVGGPRIPAWAWVAGAGGIALLAGSAVFRIDQAYVEGNQQGLCKGDVKNQCPVDYDPTADNARKNRDYVLFASLGGAGVVALGAAIIGIVTAPSPKTTDKPSAMITPWIGPGSLGAGIGGRF